MRNTKTLVGSLIGVALLSLTVLTPARARADAARAHADAQAAPAYPLKVGPTGRYLVDRHGVPVLLTGDSPQALTVNLSPHQADGFFADRKAAGFNAMWINLLCSTYTGGRPDGSTYDGIVPFTTPGDLATPNPAYFARVDRMLRLAAGHGLVAFLDPAETGSFLSVRVARSERQPERRNVAPAAGGPRPGLTGRRPPLSGSPDGLTCLRAPRTM
jgi:uncharacterized protein DUF4038